MLIIKISQLILTYIMDSMHYRESQLIKCTRISIRA